MAHFEIKDLNFAYPSADGKRSLINIDLTIERGQYVTVCGKSGSGKTTLLKHLKSVLTPHGQRTGKVYFDGRDLEDIDLREQSSRIGYVMQNPDNQIVASIVEEDVAFGPENLGIPPKEIRKRVDDALQAADMYEGCDIRVLETKSIAEGYCLT